MPIIEADGLTKTYRVFQKKEGCSARLRGLYRREYKEVHAVDGVGFTIEPGEMVAFLGPNGAGKTTTLKMLSGLIYPTARRRPACSASSPGSAPTPSAASSRWSWARRTSSGGTCPPPTASSSTARSTRSPQAEFQRTLGELTELLGVEKLTRQAVRELSLGERMKMELIAALLHQPQLLLLDEPTIGLDVVAQVAIQKCLRDYHERRGVTMLLTSHYMRDVEALCDRVLVITHGTLVYDGPLAGIVERFGESKLVKLQFAEDAARRPGPVRRGRRAARGRSADLKVERRGWPRCWGRSSTGTPWPTSACRTRRWSRSSPGSSRRPGSPMTPPDDRSAAALRRRLATATDAARHAPPGAGRWRPSRKYAKIFRVSLVERMTYRGDFLLGTILRFLPMVTTILLWQAIYDGLGPDRAGRASAINEMIAYLLLVNISRMFSSMPGLAGGIARDIREGTLKRYLIQPLDMIGYLLVVPGRAQGRLHHHVVPALRDPLLPLPGLLRRLPRRR